MSPAAPAVPESAEPLDFPFSRTCPFDPPAEYSALRRDRPVAPVRLPDGQVAWLITRHEDVRTLLTDSRVSADRGHPNLPFTEAVTPQSRAAVAAVGRALIGLDAPEHRRNRGLLASDFTVYGVKSLRPFIQRVVDQCVDELLAGPRPADLVATLAVPVPSIVLCELIGVPYADREFFQSRADATARRSVSAVDRRQAGMELRQYLDRLMTAKEADPGDDLFGRLIVRDRETAVFDHDLLVGLAMLLMIAGHESTTHMISLGAAGLLANPAQLAELREHPELLGPAVEEMLRYHAIVDTMPRVAKEDIQLGDVTIRAGDGILMGFAAANHDEKAFPDPSTMDIRRGARQHVAFGYGVHQCIGQNLARAELEIVFRTLLERVPDLRLASDVGSLPFKDDSSVYGLEALPVTW